MAQKQERAMDGAPAFVLVWRCFLTGQELCFPTHGAKTGTRHGWGTRFRAGVAMLSDGARVVLSHSWRKNRNAPWMGHPFSCLIGQLSTENWELCCPNLSTEESRQDGAR